ncbi:MAG: circadian clock KaiB family protein [Cyanobacteria bacterium]|nr:circadian clock KaiB family protein [Cyanobacteriota bacterium]MDW8200847.1 circadian clock KaiB family protein [Cyanobacteriota bacterium SKYGB_h_bin112]
MSISSQQDEAYNFRLYIAGIDEPKSTRAINNFYRMTERIAGNCDVDIVDIYTNIELTEVDRVSATPTLIKLSPPPVQRFVGDLSNIDQVLMTLRIKFDR